MASSDSADERLRHALEATVAAGTARIGWALRREDPLGPIHNRFLDYVGVIDLTQRRALIGLRAESGDMEDAGARLIYDGAREFACWKGDQRWTPQGATQADAPIASTSPLWLLDALPRTQPGASECGSAEYRDEQVSRYAVRIDDEGIRPPPGLSEMSGLFTAYRRVRRWPPEEAPTVDAETWLDQHGRVRLLSARTEPPPPPSRWTPDFVTEYMKAVAGSADQPVWKTTELWDFGVPVDIALPDPMTLGPRPHVSPLQLLNPRTWIDVRKGIRDIHDESNPQN